MMAIRFLEMDALQVVRLKEVGLAQAVQLLLLTYAPRSVGMVLIITFMSVTMET